MASIRKRPNGKWQAAISMGKTLDGKQKMIYVTKDTLKECKHVAAEIEKTRGV